MRIRLGIPAVAIIIVASSFSSFAQTYVIGPNQAQKFGAIFTGIKLPGTWTVSEISAKKDHMVVKVESPQKGLVEVGFYNPASRGNFFEKTSKFGMRIISGKADPVLMSSMAGLLNKGEANFEWVHASKSKSSSNDKKLLNRLIHAIKLYHAGKKRLAIQAVDAVNKAARSAGLVAQTGRYFMNFGMPDKGRQAFDRAVAIVKKKLTKAPDDPHVIAEAVSVYAIMGAVKAAEDLYWKLVKTHKEPIDGKVCMAGKVGSAMVEAKKDDLALDFYYHVLKTSPNCKHVYLKAMYIEAESDRFDAVDKLANRALKIWPNDQQILFGWGKAYYTSGKLRRSSEIFLRLTTINPQYPTLLTLLGNSMAKMKKTDEDIEILKDQVKEHPHNPGWYYGLGAVYFQRKEYKKALPYLQKTVKLAPDEAGPKIWLALALYWMGRKDEARKIFNLMDSMPNKGPKFFFSQAIVWADKDKKRSLAAMRSYVKVLDAESGNTYWLHKKARAQKIIDELKKGNIDAILRETRMDPEKKTTNPFLWLIGLGVLLIFIGWGYILFLPQKNDKHK